MRRTWLMTLVLIGTLVLAGCGAESEEEAVKDTSGGGIVVSQTDTTTPEKVPSTKTVTVIEGETEQYVDAVLYKSDLGYSTYLIEKFQVKKGNNRDEIISETYPQNKMVINLMPQGTELETLTQQVQNQLEKEYPQVSAMRDVDKPIKGFEVNALGGNVFKRVYMLKRSGSVYMMELYFDDYGQSTMLPRFNTMLEEMHF